MKSRKLILSTVMPLLFWNCKPDPFQTKLAGYEIQFPITMAELQKSYPNGYKYDSSRFIDSSKTTRIEWWFNNWGNLGNSDPKNQPHGLGIFLKNKSNQFDSVKTALEGYYGKPLLPLAVTRLTNEPYMLHPTVYVCHLNKNTLLTLTKAKSYGGSPRDQSNSIRISIGYNLDKTEEERFAVKDGSIHKATD